MSYYPLSQIKTNLYTNGNEFITIINNPNTLYTGYYWKTSSGKYFIGKTPQDKPNTELFLIPQIDFNKYPDIATNPTLNYINTNGGNEVNGGDNIENGDPTILYYIALKNIPENTVKSLPYYNPVLPTNQDYQNGEFRRLFCKKTNEIQYTEINAIVYNQLIAKSPLILWELYEPFNITWQLTGTAGDVARINYRTVESTSKKRKLPKLGEYLKSDYIKYYK